MVFNQTERAYQKQGGQTFQGLHGSAQSKKRYTRNAGLGFQIPMEAKKGTYVDKKCPFAGNVSIRGRIARGMVISSNKMRNTIVIRKCYLNFVKKYKRFEKRHKNVPVHCSPAFEVKDGDIVTAGQCRPLSKTVRFNTLKVTPNQIFGTARKQFRLF